eukprot:GDKK01061722.1.p1 GENE.GDKK01061722.1~~GDKK01061722.1.p1  ORF type:complete len:296 (-),score=33.48 GDKK01061722.1:55-942(-)
MIDDFAALLPDGFVNYDFDAEDFDWEAVGEILDNNIATNEVTSCLTALSPASTLAGVQPLVQQQRVADRRPSLKKKTAKSFASKNGKTRQHEAKILKWFVFPSFDKSDSMIFFPCTFARLINSGDTPKLRTFMKTHSTRGCEVSLSRDEEFANSLLRFATMMETTDIAQPDIVVCMHNTKVEANQICAVLYFKYTDAPEMYDYLDAFISDPLLKAIYTGKRKDVLTHNLQLKSLPNDEQEKIFHIISLNERLQVYGKMELNLTVDDVSKKITKIEYIGRLTSICHDGTMYQAANF